MAVRWALLALDFDRVAEVVRDPAAVVDEMSEAHPRADRLRAVAFEVAGRIAAPDDSLFGTRTTLSSMECEVWYLPLLQHLGELVGEVVWADKPRSPDVEGNLAEISRSLDAMSQGHSEVNIRSAFLTQLLARRTGIHRVDFDLQERRIGGVYYDVMALHPARIGGLSRQQVAEVLARPEIDLPFDTYEEAVLEHYDPTGGEHFRRWWSVFRGALGAVAERGVDLGSIWEN